MVAHVYMYILDSEGKMSLNDNSSSNPSTFNPHDSEEEASVPPMGEILMVSLGG